MSIEILQFVDLMLLHLLLDTVEELEIPMSKYLHLCVHPWQLADNVRLL